MLNEFSQAGLLKQLDNDTRLLMLDEADEFLQQRSAFNTLDSGRVTSENSVRCILLELRNFPTFYSKGNYPSSPLQAFWWRPSVRIDLHCKSWSMYKCVYHEQPSIVEWTESVVRHHPHQGM